MKNIVFFHQCLISPISCWHVTRLSRHSVRSKNERRCFYHSQSKVVCRNLYGLWLLKHWKIRIAYRQWRSNFPRRGRKPKYGKKTESWVLSGFGNGVSRGWERKLTTGRFATNRFLTVTWKISPVAKDEVNNWEICILKNYAHCLFLYCFNAIFRLEP